METVKEAKARLRANFNKRGGMDCPCCGQRVARYKRSLNSGMLKALDWMCFHTRCSTEQEINIPRDAPIYVTANREYARLYNWGFIVRVANDDPAKHTSGIWRLTEKGVKFRRGEIKVPKCYYMFDRKIDKDGGWSTEMVSFKEAVNNKFDIRDIHDDRDPA